VQIQRNETWPPQTVLALPNVAARKTIVKSNDFTPIPDMGSARSEAAAVLFEQDRYSAKSWNVVWDNMDLLESI
jgi:hypothetical protein